jgi:aspartyl-tRNA(Asn)/glutamyl-tRNA(Gln) amidotransferase subunit A
LTLYPGTLSQPLEQFARQPQAVRGLRLALPDSEQLPAFMDPAVTAAWQAAAHVFASLGVQVIATRVPSWYFDLSAPAGCIIASEAYALHRDYVNDESAQLGPAVRKRILAAKKFSPEDYAQTLRTMAQRRREFAGWFEAYDAMLLPTIAIPATALEQVDEASPIPAYLTRPVNYLGLCALSQPVGLVGGLPIGVQIIGKPWAERTVLALGQAFEAATPFHAPRPNLSSLGLE